MLIYIKGPDSFLAREAILRLKKKYREKNPDGVELIEIDPTSPDGLRGANSTSSSLGEVSWADLKTAPLFSTSRLIIIKRAGELPVAEQDNLASMLTDLPTSSIVVVWDAKPFKANSALAHICDNRFAHDSSGNNRFAHDSSGNNRFAHDSSGNNRFAHDSGGNNRFAHDSSGNNRFAHDSSGNKSPKIITAEPLAGSALKTWVGKQAESFEVKLLPEAITELVEQYGSDLWAIQTDLKTRQGATSASSWSAVKQEKPFIVFDYIRQQKWPELKTHLVAGYKRGEATELTIGALAAAIRKNIPDLNLKRTLTDTLSEVDLALKGGLIEPADAIALLACYLPGERLSVLGTSQKRVQWEEAWQSLV